MNPDTNQFYEAPDPLDVTHIGFVIGEEIEIKKHIFRLVHIDIPGAHEKGRQHLLVLTPVRKA
jgi:hypothetical protein